MNVVVTGSGGRLGAALCRAFGRRHRVIGLDHAALDLAQPGRIEATLEPLAFDALINCAALTNVDYCESNPAEALRVNAAAPGELAALCARRGARFIQISTDYVFDGETPGARAEDDPARPVSVYGDSKWRGELATLAASPAHLVVRVSWVFGPDRPSFLDLIVRRALEHEVVEAVADKWSSPTYSLDAARYLEPFLGSLRDVGGLLHMCNTGPATWRDYAQFALDCVAAEGVSLKAREVRALRLEEMRGFLARRPVHTVLDTSRLAGLIGEPPRPWREAVSEYLREYVVPALRSDLPSGGQPPAGSVG